MKTEEALSVILRAVGLPLAVLERLDLTGADPVLPSSFHVGAAAQASIAAGALAACEVGRVRGWRAEQPVPRVAVDMARAALECKDWFTLDGKEPPLWDPFSGLYATSDGHVRVHANFRHHRDGALRLLGLDPVTATRGDAAAAMRAWRSLEFEDAAARAGLVVAAARSFAQWDATEQAAALRDQPLLTIERIDPQVKVDPLPLPPIEIDRGPLSGVRVLDLTRILAGPVGGRALAAYGADVMLVNSPNLPNIDAIATTSRGKLSALVDLQAAEGRDAMRALLSKAHVMVQGYRPGGIEGLGFGPAEAARLRPGIVYVSLSAYGNRGPWAGRRGFDSLLQTALGFNHAEGEAAGDGKPRPMPMQILDEATGYLIACAASAALLAQQREGGSWHVRVSLAQTAMWLRSLGRVDGGLGAVAPAIDPKDVVTEPSGFGPLAAMAHSARIDGRPFAAARPSMPPGSHPPSWL